MSLEEKSRYLTETALALQRAGYEVSRTADGYLAIGLNSQPICKVERAGGITYRQGDLYSDKLVSAKNRAYEIVRTTAEYMRAMEAAPPLKAAGLRCPSRSDRPESAVYQPTAHRGLPQHSGNTGQRVSHHG